MIRSAAALVIMAGAGLLAAPARAEEAVAPAPAVSVTMAALDPLYEKQDVRVKLTFDNRGLDPIVVDSAAFARERFTLTDAQGRPPKEVSAAAVQEEGPLRVEGMGTAERVVNLSAWYRQLSRSAGIWNVAWKHDAWSGTLRAHVIRAYDARRDIEAIVDTDLGRMTWRLLPQDAPNHVKRFVDQARQGFYEGLTIYRVIPGMQAEGGDPAGDGSGAFRNVIPGELSPGVKLEQMGMVGALRPQTSMTSDSTFFITLSPCEFMRGKQTFFATVVDGIDVVAKLVQAPRRGTTAEDPYLLQTPVKIKEVRIP